MEIVYQLEELRNGRNADSSAVELLNRVECFDQIVDASFVIQFHKADLMVVVMTIDVCPVCVAVAVKLGDIEMRIVCLVEVKRSDFLFHVDLTQPCSLCIISRSCREYSGHVMRSIRNFKCEVVSQMRHDLFGDVAELISEEVKEEAE